MICTALPSSSSHGRPGVRRTNSARLSDNGMSTLESLVLECALEDARASSGQSTKDNKDCEMSALDYEELQQLPGNDCCADCGSDDTEWGSVTFGVLICAHCSGVHRNMGTHITRVKSVKMDCWSDEHMKRMKFGGNDQCNRFLQKQGIPMKHSIQEKYDSEQAKHYQQALADKMEGKGPLCEVRKPRRSSRRKRITRSTTSVSPSRKPNPKGQHSAAQLQRSHTVASSVPTITYMGRSFSAASVTTSLAPPAVPEPVELQRKRSSGSSGGNSQQQGPLRRSNTLMDWMGLEEKAEEKAVEPANAALQQLLYKESDVLEIASDPQEFARLQRTLKHNGAVTNEIIKQRMFAFVANWKKRQEEPTPVTSSTA